MPNKTNSNIKDIKLLSAYKYSEHSSYEPCWNIYKRTTPDKRKRPERHPYKNWLLAQNI